MGLLSTPTDEMRAAAHALIYELPQPHLEDELLCVAIETVGRELTAYERQVCRDVRGEPTESSARAALELALAQRISSKRLMLDSSRHEPEAPESDPPASASDH